MSQGGPAQGDSIWPELFCITLQQLLASLMSQLTMTTTKIYLWEVVDGNVLKQCWMSVVGSSSEQCKMRVNSEVKLSTLNSFACHVQLSRVPIIQQATLLGQSLLPGPDLDNMQETCTADWICLRQYSDWNSFPLKMHWCHFVPKLHCILSSSPCHIHQALSTCTFEALPQTGVCHITNCDLSCVQSIQSILPKRVGRLGFRSSSHFQPIWHPCIQDKIHKQYSKTPYSRCQPYTGQFGLRTHQQYNHILEYHLHSRHGLGQLFLGRDNR
jgi:hypothetical protein